MPAGLIQLTDDQLGLASRRDDKPAAALNGQICQQIAGQNRIINQESKGIRIRREEGPCCRKRGGIHIRDGRAHLDRPDMFDNVIRALDQRTSRAGIGAAAVILIPVHIGHDILADADVGGGIAA